MEDEVRGFFAPVHRALTEPILLGGAPRSVAILNGTLAGAVGLGLRLWIVGLAIWAVCRLFPAQPDRDALAILDARLASGEIDMDSYQRLHDLLGKNSQVRTEGLR